MKRGFTLIELLVVIGIMGVLMTVVFGSIGNARVKSRDNKRISDLKEIQYALLQYFDSNRYFPADITTPGILSPFLNDIPTDPTTDAAYDYTSPTGQTFCIGAVFENPGDINSVTDSAGCATDNEADTYTLQGS